MGMLLFFICKLSFCLFYIAFKDRKVLSLLSPLLLQPQAALPSNNSNKCYFQMGGTICYVAMHRYWLLIPLFESLHLSVLSHIFLRVLKNTVKAAPPNMSQRPQFGKVLERSLTCFGEEGSVRQGRSGAREVPSAAAEQLCTTQSHVGKGRWQWKPVSHSISLMKMWHRKKQRPGPQSCRYLWTL